MRPVNLLPATDRPRRRGGESSGTSFVVLGVLGALLVAVVVYVLTVNQVNSRRTDAAEAKREAIESERRAKALGAFGDFSKVAQARLASVSEAARGRFDWERFLRETSRVLPAGSWLTNLTASANGQLDSAAAAGGSAPAPSPTSGSSATATPTTAGGPAAKLAGCSPRQPEVAKMLVRLRRMYRVEDVTLNRSQRGTAGGAAGGTTAGATGGVSREQARLGAACGERFYEFEVTIDFKPSTLATEAPEDARKVPATLGGGS